MSAVANRYKILAHMFSRIIRNLDQIQDSSTARACVFVARGDGRRARSRPIARRSAGAIAARDQLARSELIAQQVRRSEEATRDQLRLTRPHARPDGAGHRDTAGSRAGTQSEGFIAANIWGGPCPTTQTAATGGAVTGASAIAGPL